MHNIVMEITPLVNENHGKIMELCFLNFCGNPVIDSYQLTGVYPVIMLFLPNHH